MPLSALWVSEEEKGLQGDTVIKGKHVFFLRLQFYLMATFNVTHSYARERIFGHLEMQ